VPRLVAPGPAQIRSILEESYALWGAGLTLADYVGMWEELAETAWGRRWFSWRAWVDDDGGVLSSLKLYRPLVRFGERASRAAAIGAVFTPRRERRQGHAASLILAVLEEAEGRGDHPGFLFTDIGVEYYAALGFRALACEDLLGTLPTPHARARSTGLRFRAAEIRDLDEMAQAHERTLAGRVVAVVRDREQWEFLLTRAATFFRRLDGSGIERRFVVATDRGRPVGYVVAVEGGGEWNLREAAAYDGSNETLERILRGAAAEARTAGSTSIWGWMPRAWGEMIPEWRLKSQPRLRAIPMMRPLGGAVLPDGLDAVDRTLIPYLDQF
jgi:GNAT acetyltransferase-like protein